MNLMRNENFKIQTYKKKKKKNTSVTISDAVESISNLLFLSRIKFEINQNQREEIIVIYIY